MNDLKIYLINYALQHDIGVIITDKLKPYTTSQADISTRQIIINENWHRPSEVPFMIAHEIAHILNEDVGIVYYSSFANKTKVEHSANIKAIEILLDYCELQDLTLEPEQFRQSFGIPTSLSDTVNEEYENYYRKQIF